MKYLRYLKYVLKHKWFVMLECFRYGLIWRGIMHDMSKFRPSEFFPYANFFYAKKQNINSKRDSTGYYKPTDTGDSAFDLAWLSHCRKNKHHWNYWVLAGDNGKNIAFEIPEKYITEMICDWYGAGRAQGYKPPKNDRYYYTKKWFIANSSKMTFNLKTFSAIRKLLGLSYRKIT